MRICFVSRGSLNSFWDTYGGSDADIVVYDPEADTVITAQTQLSAAGYTPYEGFKTRGSIAQVYLRGTLAVDHGEMKTGPIGTYIPRHPGSL